MNKIIELILEALIVFLLRMVVINYGWLWFVVPVFHLAALTNWQIAGLILLSNGVFHIHGASKKEE